MFNFGVPQPQTPSACRAPSSGPPFGASGPFASFDGRAPFSFGSSSNQQFSSSFPRFQFQSPESASLPFGANSFQINSDFGNDFNNRPQVFGFGSAVSELPKQDLFTNQQQGCFMPHTSSTPAKFLNEPSNEEVFFRRPEVPEKYKQPTNASSHFEKGENFPFNQMAQLEQENAEDAKQNFNSGSYEDELATSKMQQDNNDNNNPMAFGLQTPSQAAASNVRSVTPYVPRNREVSRNPTPESEAGEYHDEMSSNATIIRITEEISKFDSWKATAEFEIIKKNEKIKELELVIEGWKNKLKTVEDEKTKLNSALKAEKEKEKTFGEKIQETYQIFDVLKNCFDDVEVKMQKFSELEEVFNVVNETRIKEIKELQKQFEEFRVKKNKEVDSLNEKYQKEVKENLKLNLNLNARIDENQKLVDDQKKLAKEVDSKEEMVNKMKEEAEKQKEEIRGLNETVNELESLKRDLNDQIKTLVEEMSQNASDFKEEINYRETVVQNKETEIRELSHKLEQTELDIESLKIEVDKLEQEIKEKDNNLKETGEKIESLTCELNENNSAILNLNNEKEVLQTEKKDLLLIKETKENLEEELKRKIKESEELKNNLSVLEKNLEELEILKEVQVNEKEAKINEMDKSLSIEKEEKEAVKIENEILKQDLKLIKSNLNETELKLENLLIDCEFNKSDITKLNLEKSLLKSENEDLIQVKEEKDKLETTIRLKNYEIDSLKEHVDQLQKDLSNFKMMRESLVRKKEAEITEIQEKLLQQEKENRELKREFENLKIQLEDMMLMKEPVETMKFTSESSQKKSQSQKTRKDENSVGNLENKTIKAEPKKRKARMAINVVDESSEYELVAGDKLKKVQTRGSGKISLDFDSVNAFGKNFEEPGFIESKCKGKQPVIKKLKAESLTNKNYSKNHPRAANILKSRPTPVKSNDLSWIDF